MASPREGDTAPEFELPGTDGPFRLADHRGRRVLLLFYPGDNTPVCTRQFCSYRDHAEDVSGLDAVIVGISAQSVDSHDKFSGKHGFKFPLLSDADKAVAGAYGTLGPLGFPRRSVFIVDAGGTIRYVHRAIAGLTYRPVSELVTALKALPTA